MPLSLWLFSFMRALQPVAHFPIESLSADPQITVTIPEQESGDHNARAVISQSACRIVWCRFQRIGNRGRGTQAIRAERATGLKPAPLCAGALTKTSSRSAPAGLALNGRHTWPHRQPYQQGSRYEDCRENHFVDRRPAEFIEQLPGRERRQRHTAENKKVIEGLHFVSLVRAMTLRDHGGRAGKGEIPSESKQDQPGPEMRD